MLVKVGDDRALQAAVLAFRLAGRDLRKRINDSTRATFNAPWKTGIDSRARTRLEKRVLVPGARIRAGNPPVFVAAASRRRLRGGFVPDTMGHAVEFGAADTAVTYTATSRKGTRYQVTRHTRRQLPARRRRGPVFQTLDEMYHRVPSLWTQLIIKVYADAAEGK